MKINFAPDVTLYEGDNRETLKMVAPLLAQTCVTSPPYWKLRDYQHAAQIGDEADPDAYVSHMADVFDLVHGVVARDGTLWLNLGDTYYKKQLLGLPWKVAEALKKRGWYLRQEIIWSKPNPSTESCTNRPPRAHETIFLFSKLPTGYVFEADAIREAWKGDRPDDIKRAREKHQGYNGKHKDGYSGAKMWGQPVGNPDKGRIKRSVWVCSVARFRGAHFAVFPTKLIEPCILAGSRVGDVVLDPFAGRGTTAIVSRLLGRSSILCEVNPNYVALQKSEIAKIPPPPHIASIEA